jgi:hypothetical protein
LSPRCFPNTKDACRFLTTRLFRCTGSA